MTPEQREKARERQRRYFARHREEVLARERERRRREDSKEQRRKNRRVVPQGHRADGLLRAAEAAEVFNSIFEIGFTDLDMRRLARGEYDLDGEKLVLPSQQHGKLFFLEADVVEFATKIRDVTAAWE
jgi:hypothetical protein